MKSKISDRKNYLKVGYNYSFMPLNSKKFVHSKMKMDPNYEMFLSTSVDVRFHPLYSTLPSFEKSSEMTRIPFRALLPVGVILIFKCLILPERAPEDRVR